MKCWSCFPRYPIKKDGQLEDQEEFNSTGLKLFGLAILLIYSIMAIEFKSYLKPIGVLSAIPFGIMGAIFGHLLMGLDFSLLSLVGVLAVSGVVVNDNLVLIDRIIQLREEGEDLYEALVRGSVERFRPIILTSITTFIGLTPILMETSLSGAIFDPHGCVAVFRSTLCDSRNLTICTLSLYGRCYSQAKTNWRLREH